jgi:hypothetical protein
MAFFASRKIPADPAEIPAETLGSAGREARREAGEGPSLVSPNSMAAKALGALGLNAAVMDKTAADVKGLIDDFRDRLQRIETKLDLLGADNAELIEIVRERIHQSERGGR